MKFIKHHCLFLRFEADDVYDSYRGPDGWNESDFPRMLAGHEVSLWAWEDSIRAVAVKTGGMVPLRVSMGVMWRPDGKLSEVRITALRHRETLELIPSRFGDMQWPPRLELDDTRTTPLTLAL